MNLTRNTPRKAQHFDDDGATSVAPTAVVVKEPLYSGYPPDFAPRLIALFERIQRRGTEALFPSSWQLDFLGLPDSLFLSAFSNPSYAAIRSLSSDQSSEFRGKLAFERLLLVGRSARDRLELNTLRKSQNEHLSVEAIIKQEVKRFLHWSSTDADISPKSLSHFITFCTRSRNPVRNNPDDLQEVYQDMTCKMTQKLTRLARTHRDSVETLVARDIHKSCRSKDKSIQALGRLDNYRLERARSTTIYGFCICDSILVIVALNARSPDSPVRTLLTLDYTDSSQDLWNTLAVALTIMSAREERLDCAHLVVLRNEQDLTTTFSKMQFDASLLEDVDA